MFSRQFFNFMQRKRWGLEKFFVYGYEHEMNKNNQVGIYSMLDWASLFLQNYLKGVLGRS